MSRKKIDSDASCNHAKARSKSEEKAPKIKAEYRDLLMPLTKAEYEILEADLLKNGCLAPLVVDPSGVLLDGHNRYEICKKHNIPYRTSIITPGGKESIRKWILKQQLGRRNLTDYQRGEMALMLKEDVATRAKANQTAAGGAVPQKSAKPVDTRKELAKTAGISHDTLSKVEYITKHGDEETKSKLRQGIKETSINKEYHQLKNDENPKKSQGKKEILAQSKETSSESGVIKIERLIDELQTSKGKSTLWVCQGIVQVIWKKLEQNERLKFFDGIISFVKKTEEYQSRLLSKKTESDNHEGEEK